MAEHLNDFDTIIDRSDAGSEKWDRYAGQDIISLWVLWNGPLRHYEPWRRQLLA